MRREFTRLIMDALYSLMVLTLLMLVGCGGGGGGDNGGGTGTGADLPANPTTTILSSTTSTSTTTTIPPTNNPPDTSSTTTILSTPPASEALIGNFRFVYQIISTWTDRITLNQKSSSKTSEGTDFYTGYNADYPSVTISAGAWYPSMSRYIIVTIPTFSSPYFSGYQFIINSDNTLSGCYTLFTNNVASNCYSFIIPASHKSPLASWEMAMESQNDLIDITQVFEKKMIENQEAQVQRTESASSVDAALVSKINELKAMID